MITKPLHSVQGWMYCLKHCDFGEPGLPMKSDLKERESSSGGATAAASLLQLTGQPQLMAVNKTFVFIALNVRTVIRAPTKSSEADGGLILYNVVQMLEILFKITMLHVQVCQCTTCHDVHNIFQNRCVQFQRKNFRKRYAIDSRMTKIWKQDPQQAKLSTGFE